MEMCYRWSSSLSPDAGSVVRLLEELGDKECEAIAKRLPFKVEEKHKHLLLTIFSLQFAEFGDELPKMKNGQGYEIEGRYVLHIRSVAIKYLNMLESTL